MSFYFISIELNSLLISTGGGSSLIVAVVFVVVLVAVVGVSVSVVVSASFAVVLFVVVVVSLFSLLLSLSLSISLSPLSLLPRLLDDDVLSLLLLRLLRDLKNNSKQMRSRFHHY